jgi:hypothetical protein
MTFRSYPLRTSFDEQIAGYTMFGRPTLANNRGLAVPVPVQERSNKTPATLCLAGPTLADNSGLA